jgi:hypothetical protein
MSGGNRGAVTWHPNPGKKGELGGSDPRLLGSWGSRWLPQPLVSRGLGLVSGRYCRQKLRYRALHSSSVSAKVKKGRVPLGQAVLTQAGIAGGVAGAVEKQRHDTGLIEPPAPNLGDDSRR